MSPRRRSARPSAIVEAASSTSLTVAPWRAPAVRAASSDTSPKATARRAVALRSRPVAGAGEVSWRSAVPTSGSEDRPTRALGSAPAAERARRAAPSSRSVAKASGAAPGSGARAGDQRTGACVGHVEARGVEQQHRDLDGGDAVDERVVGLPDDGPAVRQAAYEVDAPQRVVVIERVGEQLARELAQLAGAAGRRHRHRVDVAGDVEGAVVGPVRVAEQRARHAPAEARHALQAGLEVAAQRGERRRASVDADRPADVQLGLLGLEVEERAVERA